MGLGEGLYIKSGTSITEPSPSSPWWVGLGEGLYIKRDTPITELSPFSPWWVGLGEGFYIKHDTPITEPTLPCHGGWVGLGEGSCIESDTSITSTMYLLPLDFIQCICSEQKLHGKGLHVFLANRHAVV